MADLFQTFGDEVDAILRHPLVALSIQLVVGYLVILWLAAAYWTFRDLRARTRDPLTPYLAAGGVLVLTPFAFPLGLLAYRVMRPPETLAQRRTRDLEGYVLTAEVARASCATCAATVEDDWMRCPVCGRELATSCEACGGRIEPDWSVCAWCARDLEPYGEPAVDAPPLPVPAAALLPEPPVPAAPRDAIPGWHVGPAPEPEPEPWSVGLSPMDPAAAGTFVGRPVMGAIRDRRSGVPTLVGGGSVPERRQHR